MSNSKLTLAASAAAAKAKQGKGKGTRTGQIMSLTAYVCVHVPRVGTDALAGACEGVGGGAAHLSWL